MRVLLESVRGWKERCGWEDKDIEGRKTVDGKVRAVGEEVIIFESLYGEMNARGRRFIT